LHKFEIDRTREWEEDFYNTNERLPELKELAQQMIFSNRIYIEPIIDTIVAEKFKGKGSSPCDNTIHNV
jgi:hypothetical protein